MEKETEFTMFIKGRPTLIKIERHWSIHGIKVTCHAGNLSVTSEIHANEDEALWQARMELRNLLLANVAA